VVDLALCCPITSRVKGYPFEVTVPSGLTVAGVVPADQVKSLDWRARRAEFADGLPDADIGRVLGLAMALPTEGDS
jgi:mRNA interferase MazF